MARQLQYQYVDSQGQLDLFIRELQHATRVALDTEADSLHHYYEKVCLIQISIGESQYIIDPLAQLDLAPLLDVLAAKDLIFHGCDYDLRMMRISFNFHPHGRVFDTMLAAQLLGYDRLGLAALVERYFEIVLPKTGQKADWSRRPLHDDLLVYASDDTRYLHRLARKMETELAETGRINWHREACAQAVQTAMTDNSELQTEERWRVKGWNLLTPRARNILRELWRWREGQAQRLDRPSFKIFESAKMVEIAAWADAKSTESLEDGPKLPRNFLGSRRMSLESILRRALEMPPDQWPVPLRNRPVADFEKPDETLVQALREKRNEIAERLKIDPAILAPKSTLMAIALARPKTNDEFQKLNAMMRWQIELLEPEFAPILNTVQE